MIVNVVFKILEEEKHTQSLSQICTILENTADNSFAQLLVKIQKRQKWQKHNVRLLNSRIFSVDISKLNFSIKFFSYYINNEEPEASMINMVNFDSKSSKFSVRL